MTQRARRNAVLGVLLACAAGSRAWANNGGEQRYVQQVDQITADAGKDVRDLMTTGKATAKDIVRLKMATLGTPGNVRQYGASAEGAPFTPLGLSASRAREAITRTGDIVAQAEMTANDAPKRYVVETGKKVVGILAETYNASFAQAHLLVNDIRGKVDEMAAIALVIATTNGCNQQSETKAAKAAKAALEARQTYFDRGEASLGAQIQQSTSKEIVIAERGKQLLMEAQAESKALEELLAKVPEGLDKAEREARRLSAKEGEYRSAMKGHGAGATQQVLLGAVSDVGSHLLRVDQRARELSGFLNGPLGDTIYKILDCSRATDAMARILQQDASEAAKLAKADDALYKNRLAVGAVQKMAPIYMQLAMVEGEVSDASVSVRGYRALSAPAAHRSASGDEGKAHSAARRGMSALGQ